MKKEFLRLNNLRIRNHCYEKLEFLNIIFREGESHLLFGRDHSGCVLAQFLGGEGEILSGGLFLDEIKVEDFSKETFYNAGIAYIDYQAEFMDSLDLGENLFLLKKNSLKNIIVNKKAMHIRAADILCRYGLFLDVREKAGNISAVDKVLLNIVKAADRGARLLVLNNLSVVCSGEDMERLIGILKVIKKDNTALLIYDSHPQYFMELADDIFFMEKGQLQKKIDNRQEFSLCNGLLLADSDDRKGKHAEGSEAEPMDGEYRFEQVFLGGEEHVISLKPGEIVYIAAKTREIQELSLALKGEGERPVLFCDNEHKQFYHSKQELAGLKIGFMGEELLESELFLNLTVRENILMPSLKRISRIGFYRKTAAFLFEDKEFFEELKQIEEGAYTENNMFKIICYRLKLFHPKVLILNNILTRADVGMKEWIAVFLREMAKRNTAVILLETAGKDAQKTADRTVLLGL